MVRSTSFYVMQIILLLYNIIVAIEMDNQSIGAFISLISDIIPLFTVIFLSIFVYSDYKNGYIKNIAGIVPSKVNLLLSKMVIAAIYILISFAIYIFSGLLFSVIFAKHGFTYEDAAFIQILKCLGVHFVLQFAMAMIPITLVTLSRSNALACTISILAATSSICSMVYGITMVLMAYDIIPSSFNILSFFISPYFSRVDYLSGADIILKALAVAAVYIAVMVSISIFAIKKKDVK